MKKLKLKLRIIMTNISRILWSFLFINLYLSYVNKKPVLSANAIDTKTLVNFNLETCYDAGYTTSTMDPDTITIKNVLIILIPVVIIIGIAVLIIRNRIKKPKERNKENKDNDSQKD